MRKRIRLTESAFHNMVKVAVKRILKEARKKYDPNALYIVFDGTSHYAVYGVDVEDEIRDNDVEVIDGPFDSGDESVDDIVEKLNDEAYGREYDKRYY